METNSKRAIEFAEAAKKALEGATEGFKILGEELNRASEAWSEFARKVEAYLDAHPEIRAGLREEEERRLDGLHEAMGEDN